MTDSAPLARPLRKWGRRALLLVTGLLIIVAALLVLGAFVPAIDYVGALGSVALSLWPAWVCVVAVVGGALAWWLGRGRLRLLLALLAALAALGAAVVVVRQIAVAAANDVRIGVGEPFGFSNSLTLMPPDETLTYTRDLGENLKLHIWRPKGPAPAGGWPVLVYVHGGGWVAGDGMARTADMRWFAERGWLTLSIDYSLSGPRRHLWNRATDQVGCALAWTARHVAERGGDPGRLALIGESAGGNLVLNAGYLANAGKLGSTCGGDVPRIAAISAIYPGVDLVAIESNRYPPTGADVHRMVTQYTGGSSREFPGRYAAVATATHLHSAAPPTLLFISENDHLVPLESMRAFDVAARRTGIPVRTISMPFAEHGFDITGVGNAVVRQATLQFLRQHVTAPAPAKQP